jgi:hypothetical protein
MAAWGENRYSCIAILCVSLVSFFAITLCVVSQQVFIVVVFVHFVICSVRELSDTPSYMETEGPLLCSQSPPPPGPNLDQLNAYLFKSQ